MNRKNKLIQFIFEGIILIVGLSILFLFLCYLFSKTKCFNNTIANLLPGLESDDNICYPEHMKSKNEWREFQYNDKNIPYLYIDGTNNTVKKKIYVVIFHGANNSLEKGYIDYKLLADRFKVISILVEYPGFGKRNSKINYKILFDEYPLEVKYLLYDELKIPPKSTILLGTCLGAFMCVKYLNIITEQPLYCLLNEPLISAQNFAVSSITPLSKYFINDELLNIKKYISSIKIPTLVTQGDLDEHNFYSEFKKIISLFDSNKFNFKMISGQKHCHSLVNVMEIFFKEYYLQKKEK